MTYTFPSPKEVPYEIRQKVMNHVYSNPKKLLKRASFVKIFSASLMFVGIFVLFSALYLRPSSVYENQFFDNQTSTVVSQTTQYSSASSQEINDINSALVEAEQVLSELDTLI